MIDWADVIWRLVAATAIGAAIGLNRDLHHKPTGVRTLGLVGLGSAMIVLAAMEIPDDAASPSRVIQGIVAGLGFLGAGVIVRDANDHRVRGLTTATAVWVTACIGSACALGSWPVVIVAVALIALLLGLGGRFEKWAHRQIDRRTGHDAGDGDER